MVRSLSLLSQQGIQITDTTFFSQDTLATDTLRRNIKKISPEAIDKQVTYKSTGTKRNDLVNKRVYMSQEAEVKYDDIVITADSIVFDMIENTVYATGRTDTSGTVTGKPVFKQGTQEIESDSLFYNFVTRRAAAYNIVTKQEEGLLRSQVTKLLEDGTSNIAKSTYSTCDADPPHFYIRLPKAKIYPGEKIISGPGFLVLEGIPLPSCPPVRIFSDTD